MATTQQTESKGHLRLAVDIGGTFTDIASFDPGSGKLTYGKTLSTHDSLVNGIQQGVDKAGISFEQPTLFLPTDPRSRSIHCSSAPAPERRC